MKALENYLNILHFCFYKAHYKLHLLTEWLNPFRFLADIPIIKNRLKKNGILNVQNEMNKAFGDKNFGLSVTTAGGFLFGAVGILVLSLLAIFNVFVYATMPFLIICVILSFAICYLFVFKNDKYIQYFNKYEKWSKAEKQKYSWLTFGSILALFLLFYLGLVT
jgi:hypothetical protein